MKPQFTASAYVRIDNHNIREQVCVRLNELGYILIVKKTKKWSIVTDRSIAHAYLGNWAILPNSDRFDCGTDINLFLELAQMRSDKVLGQWYKSDVMFWKPTSERELIEEAQDCQDRCKGYVAVRRATPQEVYNHLKNKL